MNNIPYNAKSFNNILLKLPERYRKNVVCIGEFRGNKTKVQFTNDICKHISNISIDGLLLRNQFDYCKTCSGIQKSLSKIPSQYHHLIDFISGSKKVQYKYQCGCLFTGTLSALAQRDNYESCGNCNREKSIIKNLPEKYHGNIDGGIEGLTSSSRVRFINDKCKHISETLVSSLVSRSQFDYCFNCVKFRADFLKRIPDKYHKHIISITENSILYKNPKCGHITKTGLASFSRRKQFDSCGICLNKPDYLSRLDKQYRNCIEFIDPNDITINTRVRYTHPKCGCVIECSLHNLLSRFQLDYCLRCLKNNDKKSFQERLLDIPEEYRSQVVLLGNDLGYNSEIEFIHSCGHKTKTIIGTFIRRSDFSRCIDCYIPNTITLDDIKESLFHFDNIQVISECYNNESEIECICKNCKAIVKGKYSNLRRYCKDHSVTMCYSCAPKSKGQRDLFDFLKSNGLSCEYDYRDLIVIEDSKQEIDIFCDSIKFGIEFNGLIWHSDKYKSKDYHWKKTKACADLGVTLLHVWDDLFFTKRDLYYSIIKAKAGLINNRIFARKTNIKELDKETLRVFLENNHIYGYVGCIAGWGLFYKDQLVQAISVRKVNNQNKKYSGYLEIARSATLANYLVVGGESKLLNQVESFARENLYSGIVNYVSCEFGGIAKNKWKFTYSGITTISYFYTDGKNRIARQKLQKRLPGQTEMQLQKQLSLHKVYSLPNMVYSLRF